MNIALFNTYKLVVPADDILLDSLAENNIRSSFFIVDRKYRDSLILGDYNYIKIKPSPIIGNNKLLIQGFYAIRVLTKIASSNFDHYIFFTQPPFLFIPASIILRFKRKKYSIYSMDVYPDLLFHFSKKIIFKRMLISLSNHAYRQAYSIVVLGECMKNLMLSKGVNEKSIYKIPNTTYSEAYGNLVFNYKELFERFNLLKGKFVILYSGNMGVPHIFSTILKVSKAFEKKYKDILFVFVGNGKRKKEIELASKQQNILILNSLNDEFFMQITNFSKCHFISLKPEFTGVSVPSKFYSSLSAGKPVLFEGSDNCEIALQIKKQNLGYVIPPYDTNRMKEIVESYYLNQDILEEHGNNALSEFKEQYSRVSLKNYYDEYVKHIIK